MVRFPATHHEHRKHIASFCGTGNIVQKLNMFALGHAFKDMGGEKVVRNHFRGYIVVQRSPEENKTRQSMLGGNSVTDGTEIF